MTKHIPHDGLDGLPRYLAIFVISLGTILTALDGSIVNIALPTIMREFNTSAASSVLIVNAYQIAMLVSMLPLAALGARVGYRRIFIGGLIVFVAASLACALSRSLPMLVISRGLQGLGASGVVCVLHAIVRSVYPARLLGRGMGINSMFVASSSTVGPSVAAAILSVAPWPYLFAINLPLGIVAIAVAWKVLPWNEPAKEKFDAKAAAMTALTIGFFVLAIDSFSHGGDPLICGIEFLIAAMIAPVLVRNQRDHPAPLLPFDTFKNRIIPLSLIAGQCAFIAQLLTFVTLPFVLHNAGFDQVAIGMAMTPWPLTIAVTAPLAGLLCDRFPPALVGTLGLSLSTLGLLLLVFLPANFGVYDVIWRMALSGFGFGLFSPPNLRQIMAAAPKHRSGVVSGLIGTNRLTGQSIGAAFAALVLTVAPMNADVLAMSIGATMTAIAAVFSLMRAPSQIAARKG
jgi:DHA2 family multidrug resistance protein-like MFS transporter